MAIPTNEFLFYILIFPFFCPGMAPAILINDTNHIIEYWQADVEEKKNLEPGQMIPFSWNDLLISKLIMMVFISFTKNLSRSST